MVKRQAVESIERQKIQMIAALYANSAFEDSDDNIQIRAKRISDLEGHFNKAIELVYNPELHKQEEIDWTNPFWAAAKRSYDRKLEEIRGRQRVSDVVSPEQIEARRESRRKIDQLA